jgi:hypothetical protein
VTGAALEWSADANGQVYALQLTNSTLIVGGSFTRIGGVSRGRLAAIKCATGEVTPWDPNADDDVYALAPRADMVLVGGFFMQVAGLPRQGLAAVDATTGVPTDWSPAISSWGWVNALAPRGDTVYVGGVFDLLGGAPRRCLGAVDARSGVAASWDPKLEVDDALDPTVRGLAIIGDTVYVGGHFSAAGGAARRHLAAVDAGSGSATSWDPGADGQVWCVSQSGDTVYVGGRFTRLGGLPCASLAAILPPAPPIVVPKKLILASIVPNPSCGEAVVHYALPAPSRVALTIYDLQGRRVKTVMDHQLEGAGPHDVPIGLSGWRPGVYLCRLEADGAHATRKMVIVR